MDQFEEWRVTGQPSHGFPDYNFTWSPDLNPHLGDPETAARAFAGRIRHSEFAWTDGPHLHRRTVTRTDWAPVDTDPSPANTEPLTDQQLDRARVIAATEASAQFLTAWDAQASTEPNDQPGS